MGYRSLRRFQNRKTWVFYCCYKFHWLLLLLLSEIVVFLFWRLELLTLASLVRDRSMWHFVLVFKYIRFLLVEDRSLHLHLLLLHSLILLHLVRLLSLSHFEILLSIFVHQLNLRFYTLYCILSCYLQCHRKWHCALVHLLIQGAGTWLSCMTNFRPILFSVIELRLALRLSLFILSLTLSLTPTNLRVASNSSSSNQKRNIRVEFFLGDLNFANFHYDLAINY